MRRNALESIGWVDGELDGAECMVGLSMGRRRPAGVAAAKGRKTSRQTNVLSNVGVGHGGQKAVCVEKELGNVLSGKR